jgi:hypothetical protein
MDKGFFSPKAVMKPSQGNTYSPNACPQTGLGGIVSNVSLIYYWIKVSTDPPEWRGGGFKYSKLRSGQFMDTSTLFAGVFFGALGMGYIVYGRKQKRGIALLSGILLCGLPYFIGNIFLLVIASIVAAALPFFIQY